MTVAESSWNAAVEAINAADHPVLACHLGPDGDALGSMVALGLGLAKQGRSVTASWSEPFGIPKQYAFLPGLDLVSPPSTVPESPELMVTFDAGSLERLGTLEKNARNARTLICVDHHRSNDLFGTVNLVDPDAAASAVLVFELLERLGIPLDAGISANLYTALMTDTGRFQYRNTTPPVMRMAGELLSHGIEHDRIARLVYDTHPMGYLRLLAGALGRLELLPDASMIWTWIDSRDLRDAGVTLEDTEALIDVVRTAQEAEVACVLKQTPDGRYKVSMRSKGASDVGAVCEAFGGGGHALAAGFTSDDGDPRAIALAVAARLRSR